MGLVLVLSCDHRTDAQTGGPGHWVQKAAMPTARQEIPHVVFNDRIYIPGGLSLTPAGLDIVEVFDPATNSWDTIPPLPESLHHTAAANLNGKLFVIGGYEGNSFNPSGNVYAFDPDSGFWTEKSALPFPRGAHAAVVFQDSLYVFGGTQSGVATGITLCYNPGTDEWTSRAPMPTAREHLAAAAIDSLIYVVGGRDFANGPGNYGTLEAYAPASNTWYTLPDMPTIRGGLAAAVLHGKLHAFGGEIPGVFANNEAYNPATNDWEIFADLPTARHGMGAVTVRDTVYVIGGALVAGFAATDVNEAFVAEAVVGVPDARPQPAQITLFQNYPNPFNPETVITFSIEKATRVRLTVHNALGEHVATLADGFVDRGRHMVRWNAKGLSSGVYFYRMATPDYTQSKKTLFIK